MFVGFGRELIALGLLGCHRELLMSGEPDARRGRYRGVEQPGGARERAVLTRWRRKRNGQAAMVAGASRDGPRVSVVP
jgi:hypothetical protein